MSLVSIDPVLATTIVVAVMVFLLIRRPKRAYALPPGPRKLPIIGNLLDMPRSFEWEQYSAWAKEFDTDIIHLEVVGQHIIVLNSYEACIDLLDKRSKLYSSRPPFAMTVGVVGIGFNVFTMSYGDKWRLRRRLMHGALHPAAAARLRPIVSSTTHTFLRGVLGAGRDDLEAELRHMAGRLILGVAYGIEVPNKDDPRIVDAEALLKVLTQTSVQGAYLVNSIPALKHVPEWVPGAGFQALGRQWRGKAQDIVDRPFNEVKERMLDGGPSKPCFTMNALEKGIDDVAIRDAAATMYNGGTDTTVITLLNFTLAMLDNPELQRRAQLELDAVLGPLQTPDGKPGKLPTFSEQAQLPFISALVRESSRYKPVLPGAIPHAHSGSEPDIYNGYVIPAGSIVIPNTWAMMHDESVYPDPDSFKPERFLTADGKLDPNMRDPANMAFGFGRRACVGRYLADSSLWLMIAVILRVYNIEKAKDADGTVIEPHREWLSSLLMYPKHFKCAFVPRSAAAEAMIRETETMEY
ncbi:cytochrome P450 [Schizophyllum fasciatum]